MSGHIPRYELDKSGILLTLDLAEASLVETGLEEADPLEIPRSEDDSAISEGRLITKVPNVKARQASRQETSS